MRFLHILFLTGICALFQFSETFSAEPVEADKIIKPLSRWSEVHIVNREGEAQRYIFFMPTSQAQEIIDNANNGFNKFLRNWRNRSPELISLSTEELIKLPEYLRPLIEKNIFLETEEEFLKREREEDLPVIT